MTNKSNVSGFSKRLKLVLKDESVNSFAERAGLKEGSIRQYISGSTPGIDKASQIAKAANVSLGWLIEGVGNMRSELLTSSDGFAFVPRLDVTASAGNGSFAISEDTEGMLAFRSDWLRDRGINPKMASALTVAGDSMEPVIRDGDILLVDRSIDYVKDNGIYVVVIGGLLVVKRVHTGMDGSVTLISDNTVYPPETICANEVGELIFAGRVMWFGRSI